jgi:hypothetical protein
MRAAREIHDFGTFRFSEDATPYAQLNNLMAGR